MPSKCSILTLETSVMVLPEPARLSSIINDILVNLNLALVFFSSSLSLPSNFEHNQGFSLSPQHVHVFLSSLRQTFNRQKERKIPNSFRLQGSLFFQVTREVFSFSVNAPSVSLSSAKEQEKNPKLERTLPRGVALGFP